MPAPSAAWCVPAKMGPMTDDPVATAQRLADEVLFPAALDTDAADTVPREQLDALADAGLYGLLGPPAQGGLGADLTTLVAVTEALAGGCLTSAFVWAQHVKTVVVAAASDSETVRGWVELLCRGELRSGLALAGALPGPEQLRATATPGGWWLAGPVPWVSGWGRVDVLHTAAVADDGSVVWSLIDAHEGQGLTVERVRLAALDATATVNVAFDGFFVPSERVTVTVPPGDGGPPDPATLRIHAAFAVGVADRCCRLLGDSPLDEELAKARRRLDAANADTMPDARAGASELAVRCATALMSATGSSSLRRDRHPQRLTREALFTSVFAARSPIKESVLKRLGAALPSG